MVSAQRFQCDKDGVIQGFGVVPGAVVLIPLPERTEVELRLDGVTDAAGKQAVGLDKLVVERVGMRRYNRDQIRERIMYLISVGVFSEYYFTSKEVFDEARLQYAVLQTVDGGSFIREENERIYNRTIEHMVQDAGDLVSAAIRTALTAGANVSAI